MDPQDPKIRWLKAFFDVSEPYLYVMVLPPLILFALGMRRLALLFFLGAVALFAILGVA
jgi:hypothetical protein